MSANEAAHLLKIKMRDYSEWDGECRVWSRSRHSNGYGRIKKNGVDCLAHRVAWELLKGPIPDGLCVLHRCDNPPCINPQHLFLGTVKDNARDMMEKGRNKTAIMIGETNGRAKLDEANIYAIRDLYASGKQSQQTLAYRFNVGRSTIGDIIRFEKWKHLS